MMMRMNNTKSENSLLEELHRSHNSQLFALVSKKLNPFKTALVDK